MLIIGRKNGFKMESVKEINIFMISNSGHNVKTKQTKYMTPQYGHIHSLLKHDDVRY